MVIQTAFIGDVILATGLIEKLAQYFPDAQLDFLVRKGNEPLLKNNPHIKTLLIWNKQEEKYSSLYNLLKQIRSAQYDIAINLQRFGATGLLTGLSGANQKIGFKKNPFSFLFNKKVKHEIGNGTHEIERNHQLIANLTDQIPARPRLYPSQEDFEKVAQYKTKPYIVVAPTSVWFTKQFPAENWVDLINNIPEEYTVYTIGGPPDRLACEEIIQQTKRSVINLAGKLHFLASAALMKDAQMNYVNDSGPMHIASSVNAITTAIFCSTVPSFGFGPLSSKSFVVETEKQLACRPCGLHGYKTCPQKHFDCGKSIRTNQLVELISK